MLGEDAHRSGDHRARPDDAHPAIRLEVIARRSSVKCAKRAHAEIELRGLERRACGEFERMILREQALRRVAARRHASGRPQVNVRLAVLGGQVPRDDVHHAADRIGAVERRALRPPDDRHCEPGTGSRVYDRARRLLEHRKQL
jgi:hypothetical protein